jgi:histidinol-phosphatase (PHP family)
MAEAAIEKGLKYLCFTEHLDHNPGDYGFGFYDHEKYSEAIDRARDLYGARIVLLKGIEFGEPHLYRNEFEKELERDYDIVLGSMHYLGQEGFYGEKGLRDRYSLEQLWEMYFESLSEMVGFGGFDVLAHFDFPARYYGDGSQYPTTAEDVVRELARKGIALEINTSGLRKGLARTLPGRRIIQEFGLAGGKMVTFGSDSHSCQEIGTGFETGLETVSGTGLVPGVFIRRRFQSLAR